MLPTIEELKTAIEQNLSGAVLTVEGGALVVEPNTLIRVCTLLKQTYQMDYVSNLAAVDYLPSATDADVGPGSSDPLAGAGRIEVVYHLYSMAQKQGPVALKVKLPRENPVVASLTPLYRGAEFQEREAYDLYGVRFEGHSDLRRILMWDGFQGHPMRKDYVVEDQNVLEESQS